VGARSRGGVPLSTGAPDARRKLAAVKLGTAARFKLKFRVKTAGTYRIKYAYKGNATVVAGSATEVVKLKR
jgi:hypothetical protein